LVSEYKLRVGLLAAYWNLVNSFNMIYVQYTGSLVKPLADRGCQTYKQVNCLLKTDLLLSTVNYSLTVVSKC